MRAMSYRCSRGVSRSAFVCMVAALAVLTITLAGCGADTLVGKWTDNTGAIWEFTEDGRVITGTPMPPGVGVTYTAEDGVLTMSAPGREPFVALFEVDGDTLRLTNPDDNDEVETMRRAK